jgi:VanZ family protein
MGFLFPLTNDTLSSNSTSYFIVPIIKWFLPNASQATINTLHILFRKSVHFFEYAFLAFLLFRGFRRGNKSWSWKWIIYAGLIAIGYGFLDEFLQTLITSRTGSIFDWVIDSTGALSTLGIIYIKDKL